MGKKYTYPKDKFLKKEGIRAIAVNFTNGDYLEFSGEEILEFSPLLCDKLQVFADDGICFTAGGGMIKIKPTDNIRAKGRTAFLQDFDAFCKGESDYIEDRCTMLGEISHLELFDENCWRMALYGKIAAKKENGCLIFAYEENGDTSSDDGYIYLADTVDKDNMIYIDFDFDNCEMFTVFLEEIADMSLKLSDTLVWNGGSFIRSIETGFLSVRIDKELSSERANRLRSRERDAFALKKRLCSRFADGAHDLVNLYIEHPYGNPRQECIKIIDPRPEEFLTSLYDLYDREDMEEDDLPAPIFIGGYAKYLKDKTIVITLGKEAKRLLENY